MDLIECLSLLPPTNQSHFSEIIDILTNHTTLLDPKNILTLLTTICFYADENSIDLHLFFYWMIIGKKSKNDANAHSSIKSKNLIILSTIALYFIYSNKLFDTILKNVITIIPISFKIEAFEVYHSIKNIFSITQNCAIGLKRTLESRIENFDDIFENWSKCGLENQENQSYLIFYLKLMNIS